MLFRSNQAISLARIALNDTDATGYRYSDADLLQYGNDALDAIAHARPELFYSDAEITPVTGKTLQTFSAADSLGLADILYVKNGGVVRQIDRASLDTTYPNWPTAPPGAPIHWMRLLNAPNGFVLFPPPEVGVVLVGVYVKAPSEYAGTATLPVSNAFIPPI